MAFIAWISGLLDRFCGWVGSKDSREGAAFSQSLLVNERLLSRVDNLETQTGKLIVQNAEQAAQMNVLREDNRKCMDAHKECDDDRKQLSADVVSLRSEVAQLKTKVNANP